MKIIELDMLDYEDDDTINDEVRRIEPTSGTDTHKSDDELIIRGGGNKYDDLINDHLGRRDE